MLWAKEGYITTSSLSSRTENVFAGITKCNTTYMEGVKINHSVYTKMEADLLLKSPKITILTSWETKDWIYSFKATRLNVGSRVVFCHVLLPDGTTVNLQLILSFPNHHDDSGKTFHVSLLMSQTLIEIFVSLNWIERNWLFKILKEPKHKKEVSQGIRYPLNRKANRGPARSSLLLP